MSDPLLPNKNGIKVTTPGSGGNNFSTASDQSRTLPRQVSTGSTRGTQTVGYGDTKIDGSNNVITVGGSILLDGTNEVIQVTNDDGSTLGLGKIPGTNEFGFFSKDTSGNLIMKIVNGTWYVYRPDATNVMQSGILPDSTAGWAVASDNHEVSEGF
jgi:hypothetical protein